MEAAYKLVLQYFQLIGKPDRKLVIAREQSYHGTTLAALSIGGHRTRRQPFNDVLTETYHVSPCNPYRDMREGETKDMYVLRLKQELRRKFQELGPENVGAFIAEPVVGAVSFALFLASRTVIQVWLLVRRRIILWLHKARHA